MSEWAHGGQATDRSGCEHARWLVRPQDRNDLHGLRLTARGERAGFIISRPADRRGGLGVSKRDHRRGSRRTVRDALFKNRQEIAVARIGEELCRLGQREPLHFAHFVVRNERILLELGVIDLGNPVVHLFGAAAGELVFGNADGCAEGHPQSGFFLDFAYGGLWQRFARIYLALREGIVVMAFTVDHHHARLLAIHSPHQSAGSVDRIFEIVVGVLHERAAKSVSVVEQKVCEATGAGRAAWGVRQPCA